MSNYIEYKDRMAFHPGYYIQEELEALEMTQEEFAKRLDTTPKNLSILIRGEQSLSIDMAMKLARFFGTSINFWLNLQNAFNIKLAEFRSEEETERERILLKSFDYKYFENGNESVAHTGKKDEQILNLRKYLGVSTLSVFRKRDVTTFFRSAADEMTEDEIIKANVMVQIAVNKAMKIDAPRYNRKKLEELLPYILEETINEKAFYPFLREAFRHAGVVFIAVPNMPGSTIIGAVRRVNEKMLMMMNGKRMNADVFWFTIFHEIGHILNGDYGITVEHEAMENDPEYEADKFAEKMLIPENEYKDFVENNVFTMKTIKEFASSIKRNPSIVLGQLERDGIIKTDDSRFSALRRKYRIEDEDDSKQA